ncbi:MAG: adenylyl-sulfate kinase [Candidatus Bathyarchaeia archaeon]
MQKGYLIWLTGLPSSGKTTIARRIEAHLKAKGFKVELLDGDEVRKWLSPEAGFSREDRERHLRRVAYVSKLLVRNGVAVLASFVSPYRNVRDEARRIIEAEGFKFIEVYVKCSVEECIRRDPKALYAKAMRGEIGDMTGIQDVYEEPLNPEVVVDSEREDVDECAEKVLNKLKELNLI